MRIAVIQGSSMADKNAIMYEAVRKHAEGHEVIDLGCRETDSGRFSYIEISVLIGIMLSSGAVDFVVTGCASGQGMMLACNSMPGVLCGYAPTPQDAYLFAQINDGNAVSLPLGEGYTWNGEENLERTVEKLFSEPFGQGWPKADADRKLRDTALLKKIRKAAQGDMVSLLDSLDRDLVRKILGKTDAISFVLENGKSEEIKEWIRKNS